MIIDSFDISTEPVMKMEDFYGPQKHLINKCLVIFSSQIYEYLLKNYECVEIGRIFACNGSYPIYKFKYNNEEIGFYLSMIGSTMAAQFVIEANWIVGATHFVMFGSAGNLNKDATLGKYIIPTSAYRAEGMSYHYMEPTDYIDVKNHQFVKEVLDNAKIPNILGKTWTTDAFLRETKGLIKKRKEEGCITVEMEIAGVQAVCNFYHLELYSFLEAGDVLSEEYYEVKGLNKANHNLDKLFVALEIIKAIK